LNDCRSATVEPGPLSGTERTGGGNIIPPSALKKTTLPLHEREGAQRHYPEKKTEKEVESQIRGIIWDRLLLKYAGDGERDTKVTDGLGAVNQNEPGFSQGEI